MKDANNFNDNCVVYLLRHGDSRLDSVKRYIGEKDAPLNETGRIQACWWKDRLATVPFQSAFSSDLLRSRETLDIITSGRDIPVSTLFGLREISVGMWDGLSMEETRKTFPEEYTKRGTDPAGHRPPGGESFNELRNRVAPIFEDIIRKEKGPVLIVGHAGVNRVLLCHLLGMPLENLFRIGQDYGCVNVIVREKGHFSLKAMNIRPLDHSFLF